MKKQIKILSIVLPTTCVFIMAFLLLVQYTLEGYVKELQQEDVIKKGKNIFYKGDSSKVVDYSFVDNRYTLESGKLIHKSEINN